MAIGGPKPSSFYIERQALTRSPATPTVPGAGGAALRTSNQAAGQNDPGIANPTAGDGLVLAGLAALVVSVWPNPGNTLSGAGNLLCWVFNPYMQLWSRCPDLDLTLSTTSGLPAQTFSTILNPSRLGGFINFLSNGITVSGGTDVLIRIDGFQSVLGMGTA